MKLRNRRMVVVISVLLMVLVFLLLIWIKVSHPARNPDLWLFDLAVLGLVFAWAIKDSLLTLWRRDSASMEANNTPSDADEGSAQEILNFSSKNDFSLTE